MEGTPMTEQNIPAAWPDDSEAGVIARLTDDHDLRAGLTERQRAAVKHLDAGGVAYRAMRGALAVDGFTIAGRTIEVLISRGLARWALRTPGEGMPYLVATTRNQRAERKAEALVVAHMLANGHTGTRGDLLSEACEIEIVAPGEAAPGAFQVEEDGGQLAAAYAHLIYRRLEATRRVWAMQEAVAETERQRERAAVRAAADAAQMQEDERATAAAVEARGVVVGVYVSPDDDAVVVQVDTGDDGRETGRVRVNVNDAAVWDADPEEDEPSRPGALSCAECGDEDAEQYVVSGPIDGGEDGDARTEVCLSCFRALDAESEGSAEDASRECAECGDEVATLSSRDWCDACEAVRRCATCGEAIDADDVHASATMCGSCEHNAARSGA
jgi:hypothetical protein